MSERLASALPSIRRARGYFVYSHDGIRYLDCYLNGGRAILGHRPAFVSTVVKDVISTGAYADYPSPHSRRLCKQLSRTVPTHPAVRLYETYDRALAAAAEAVAEAAAGSTPPVAVRPIDPALGPRGAGGAAGSGGAAGASAEGPAVWLWRPFLGPEHGVDYGRAAVLLPVVPFPARWCGQAVCARAELEPFLRESDILSPVSAAAQLRSLHTLETVVRGGRAATSKPSRRAPDPGVSSTPAVPPALACFVSRGPYLSARIGREEYSHVFYTFLEKGIILHPDSGGPSIWTAGKGSRYHKTFVELDRICGDELGLVPTA